MIELSAFFANLKIGKYVLTPVSYVPRTKKKDSMQTFLLCDLRFVVIRQFYGPHTAPKVIPC